jgi:hypothetical protein
VDLHTYMSAGTIKPGNKRGEVSPYGRAKVPAYPLCGAPPRNAPPSPRHGCRCKTLRRRRRVEFAYGKLRCRNLAGTPNYGTPPGPPDYPFFHHPSCENSLFRLMYGHIL